MPAPTLAGRINALCPAGCVKAREVPRGCRGPENGNNIMSGKQRCRMLGDDGRRLRATTLGGRAALAGRGGVPSSCVGYTTGQDASLKSLAGAEGIEPSYGGIKIRCLTAWLRPITRQGTRVKYMERRRGTRCRNETAAASTAGARRQRGPAPRLRTTRSSVMSTPSHARGVPVSASGLIGGVATPRGPAGLASRRSVARSAQPVTCSRSAGRSWPSPPWKACQASS
jgi:hypothetical protein